MTAAFSRSISSLILSISSSFARCTTGQKKQEVIKKRTSLLKQQAWKAKQTCSSPILCCIGTYPSTCTLDRYCVVFVLTTIFFHQYHKSHSEIVKESHSTFTRQKKKKQIKQILLYHQYVLTTSTFSEAAFSSLPLSIVAIVG